MNTYRTSNNERFTQSQIERKITNAKAEILQNQIDELGYNVCTICYRNDCKPIDVSHNVSVKEAKESGRSELAWSVDNLEIIGRSHHQEKDGLNLQFSIKK